MSRNNNTSRKSNKLKTNWLSNALRSTGSIMGSEISTYIPSITAVANSGLDTGRKINNAVHSGSVKKTLSNNRYLKAANTAFKNALDDIKTGNFDNMDRTMQAYTGGSSIDDSDIDLDSGDVNVTVNDSGASFAIAKQLQKNQESSLKTNKASVDAVIAVQSASIAQTAALGEQILDQLNGINSNLSALVAFNNDTMASFASSAMAFYDKIGKQMTGENDQRNRRSDPYNRSNLFGAKRALDPSAYKKMLKNNFQRVMAGTPASDLLSMDDTTLEALASNPIGMAGSMLAGYMVPSILKSTLTALDQGFSTLMPSMMQRLSDMGNDPKNFGTLKQKIGQIFGINFKDSQRIGVSASLHKGPIPFDSETKHAITEVITKELSTQTSYLKSIADAMGVDTKYAENSAKRFDMNTGKWRTSKELKDELVSGIYEELINGMKDSFLGDKLNEFVFKQDPKKQNSANKLVNQFLYKAYQTKDNGFVDLSDGSKDSNLSKLMDQLKASKEDTDALKKFLIEASKNNLGFKNSMSQALYQGNGAKERRIENIQNDPTRFNLYATGISDDTDISALLDNYATAQNYQKGRKGHSFNSNDQSNRATRKAKDFAGKMAGHGVGYVRAIFGGDTKGAISELGGMATEQLKVVGDVVKSHFALPLRNLFVGDGTEKGKEESVLGKLKKTGKELKDSIVYRLFGKPDDDKDGKSKPSFINTVGSVLSEGLNGWKIALFGDKDEDYSDPKNRQKLIDKVNKNMKDRLGDGIVGSIIGAGSGALMGSSILGTLVGGPIGGALIGFGVGLVKKSKGFQDFLFGEEVEGEDGKMTRTGGIITKRVQDFFNDKNHKQGAIGGAAVGAASSILLNKTGGILGTIVGGPVVGALTGMASGLILKSHTFQEFLFGDGKDKKGLKQKMADAFNASKKKQTDEFTNEYGKKSLGTALVGAGGGAMTAAAIGKAGILGASLGPTGIIGGALLGLASGIMIHGQTFKKFLFGEEIEGPDGKKKHKHGLFGQFGNLLNAHVIRPLADNLEYHVKDAMIELKHTIFPPVEELLTRVSGGFGKLMHNVEGFSKNILGKVNTIVLDPIKEIITKTVIDPAAAVVKGAANIVYQSTKRMVTLPFKALNFILEKTGVKKGLGEIKNFVKKKIGGAIGWVAKKIVGGIGGIFKFVTAPLRGAAGLVTYASRKLDQRWATKHGANEGYDNTPESTVDENADYGTRSKQHKHDAKAEREKNKEEYKLRKLHNKNAKAIEKATHGQYSDDTQEARDAALRANPRLKLNTSLLPEDEVRRRQQEKNKEATNGKGTHGMSSDDLSNANVTKLNDQAKIVYYMQGIWNMIRGKDWNGKGESPLFKKITGKGKKGSGIGSSSAETAEETEAKNQNTSASTQGEETETSKDARFHIKSAEEIANDIENAGGLGGYIKGGFQNVTNKFRRKKKVEQGQTAEESRAEDAEEEQSKEKKSVVAKLLVNTKETATNVKEHAKNWAFTFGKKGIITLALIGLIPLLTKVVGFVVKHKDTIISGIKTAVSTLGSILSAIGELAGGVFKQIWDAQTNKELTNGDSISDRVGANWNRKLSITNENGDWDHQSGSRLKLAAQVGRGILTRNYNPAKFAKESSGLFRKGGWKFMSKHEPLYMKATRKISRGVEGAGKWFAGTKAGTKMAELGRKGLDKGKTFVNKHKDTIIEYGKKGLSKAKDSKVAKVAYEDVTKLKNNSELLTKICDGVKSIFTKIKSKVSEKLGTKLTEEGLKIGPTKIIEVVKKHWDDIAEKIASKLGIKGGAATVTAGLSELAFATVGAINGVTGTAKLFHVDKDAVDGTMKIISAVLSGLLATSIGSIVDVICQLIYDILGCDLLNVVAVWIYKGVKGKESEAAKKLTDNQEKFKDEYDEYKNGELKKAYDTQKKAQLIGKDVTFEQFVEGVKDGTYNAEYKSFSDWNTEKNASFSDKAGKTVSSAWKGIKNATKKVFGGKSKVYQDKNGVTYIQNENGGYNVIVDGQQTGTIQKKSLPSDAQEIKNDSDSIIVKLAKGIGNLATGGMLNATTAAKDAATVKSATDTAKSSNSGGSGKGKSKGKLAGGKGEGTSLNGHTYYSQNDARWKDASYSNGDGATIGDSGCGPDAMAMVASDVTGKNINPTQMASLAQSTGDRDDTGTNWNFINNASNAMGISNQQALNPSAAYIGSQLANGNQMILSGQDTGDGKSAYTKAGHYVVAVGMDRDGNAIINDPRGTSTSGKYPIGKLASQTGSAWTFGGGGQVEGMTTSSHKTSQGDAIRAQKDANLANLKAENGGVISMDNPTTRGQVDHGTNDDSDAQALEHWMNCVKEIKQKVAAQNPTYSQSGSMTITLSDSVSMSMRTDCSGYVSACINYFTGGGNLLLNSTGFANASNSQISSAGFSSMPFTTMDALQEGDIVAIPNKHVEIFSRNDGSRHYVYSCGSTEAMRNPGETVSGYSSYTTVWRVNGATASNAGAGYTVNPSSGNAKAKKMSFSDKLSALGSFFSEVKDRALTGITTGKFDTDYSGFIKNLTGDSSDSSSDSSSSTSSGNTGSAVGNVGNAVATKISNSESLQKTWQYFRNKGLPPNGVAGLMGNLQAESGIQPVTVQSHNYNGWNDETYTQKVDSGEHTKFTSDSKGYGLAQWTSSGRKQGLLNLAKQKGTSVGDLNTQLDYLDSELQGSYKGVWNTISNPNVTLQDASNSVLHDFESPKDQSASVENTRASYGQNVLNLTGGKGNGVRGSRNRGGGYGVSQIRKHRHLPQVFGGFGDTTTAPSITDTLDSAMNSTDFSSSMNTMTTAQNYVTTTKNNNTNEILINALNILATIATNTGNTTEAVKALQSLTGNGGSGDTYNVSTNPSTTMLNNNQPARTQGSTTRNEQIASTIAKGY